MKLSFILLTILIFSCQNLYSQNADVDRNLVVGKWTINLLTSVNENGEVSTVFNVPPEITFENSGFAKIGFSKNEEKYNWIIENGYISFSPIEKSDNRFIEGKFKMSFTKNKGSVELKLMNLAENHYYTLRK